MPVEQMKAGQPERPIQTSAEDLLVRGSFVNRLADALINSGTQKSTGVVIGITGSWGSGKSSILNLLNEHIAKRYPKAHVVRFDPWLVSGRNDIITEFLRELLSTFKRENQKQKALIKSVAKYGELLAPIANLAAVGAGAVVGGSMKAVSTLISKGESVAALKKSLFEQLSKLDEPVVVLIDELDRIEDAEIRTVAQLVRSVADFPGISYAIAYDAHRVMQALGSGASSSDQAERGRA